MVWKCTWCKLPMKAMADFKNVKGKPTVVYQCDNKECSSFGDYDIVTPSDVELLNIEKEPSANKERDE